MGRVGSILFNDLFNAELEGALIHRGTLASLATNRDRQKAKRLIEDASS